MDLLAYADGTDKTYSNMTFVLACIASVGVIAVLTIPIAMESFFRIWDPSYVYNGS